MIEQKLIRFEDGINYRYSDEDISDIISPEISHNKEKIVHLFHS